MCRYNLCYPWMLVSILRPQYRRYFRCGFLDAGDVFFTACGFEAEHWPAGAEGGDGTSFVVADGSGEAEDALLVFLGIGGPELSPNLLKFSFKGRRVAQGLRGKGDKL